LSFRILKQYFNEKEEVMGNEEENKDKNKKNKVVKNRDVFYNISEFHQNFDDLVNQFQNNFEVNVIDSCANLTKNEMHMLDKNKNQKTSKNKKESTKNTENLGNSINLIKTNNLSWNYFSRTPSEEVLASKNSIPDPCMFTTKTPFPTFSPFIKSDFWTRLHCLYDFDPIMKPLKEMDLISQNSFSNNQSSQFKFHGSGNISTEENSPNKDNSIAVNPWGANISGITDFYHSPNEFIFWLSNCLQGIIDNNMQSTNNFSDSFLQNIYPKKNNYPMFSQTGEYWIKLNYMGKEVKVVVDDRLPVDCLTGDLMVPLTETGEIWPALYMKAICKLFGIGDFYRDECVMDVENVKTSSQNNKSEVIKEVKQPLNETGLHQEGDINSSFLKKNNLINSSFLKKSKVEEKENINSANKKQKRLIEAAYKKSTKRYADFVFEDLISNIDVIYTVTGFIPLVLNTKNWDSVFFNKFCESISEHNTYENKIKIFGLKQIKVTLINHF
jgi:hypothetical protein